MVFSTSKAVEKNHIIPFSVLGFSFAFDSFVKKTLQSNRGETLDNISSFFNQFGSKEIIFIPFATYSLSLMENNKDLGEASIRALFSGITAVSLTFLIKTAVKRPRPDKSDKKSFPSGHTALSFAIFHTYASNTKGFYRYLFYIFPVGVAFSRIYKNHHYLSDVIAGSLVGIYSSILVNRIGEKYLKTSIYYDIFTKKVIFGVKYSF